VKAENVGVKNVTRDSSGEKQRFAITPLRSGFPLPRFALLRYRPCRVFNFCVFSHSALEKLGKRKRILTNIFGHHLANSPFTKKLALPMVVMYFFL